MTRRQHLRDVLGLATADLETYPHGDERRVLAERASQEALRQLIGLKVVAEKVQKGEHNRYHLCDRERLRGYIGETDFGTNTYCIARSPVAALIWNGGGPYWSHRGAQAYGASKMVGFTRAMLASHNLINYKKNR